MNKPNAIQKYISDLFSDKKIDLYTHSELRREIYKAIIFWVKYYKKKWNEKQQKEGLPTLL